MYPDADPMPRPPGPWRARRETPARQQQRMAVAHPCQMPDSVAVWDGDSRSCVAGSSRLSGVPERQQAAATGGCCGGRSAPAKIRLFACSPAPSISAVSRAVVCTCSHGRTGSWCMWDVAHGVNEARRRDGSVEVPASPSLSSPMAVVVNRCRVGLWGGGGDAVAGFSEPWRHVRRKSKNAKEVESGFQNLGGGNSDQSNQVAALPYVRPVVTSHAATPTPASWRGECRPSGWPWRTLHTGQHQGRQVLVLALIWPDTRRWFPDFATAAMSVLLALEIGRLRCVAGVVAKVTAGETLPVGRAVVGGPPPPHAVCGASVVEAAGTSPARGPGQHPAAPGCPARSPRPSCLAARQLN
ncbi:hypothetical protein ACCO45_005691 [Purpureocillium lilacinum]|uniref:Uncharacterized protein n=1 Tax=Purpureocillium lilacinum TaxID=33203 RepID=A0ACC4DW65_PURLI